MAISSCWKNTAAWPVSRWRSQKQALAHQQDAIERQKLAVDTQLKHVRLYRRIIFSSIPVIVFLLWVLVRMLCRV
ncbi:MAG: hypothetical protein ABUS47_01480 [Steroidobacter sp.]